MRLDHLLSKEHTPRTIYRTPALVGVAVWWALVVFTSGIIDERCLLVQLRRLVLLLAFGWWCGTGWWLCGGWLGTLLGPEGSGREGLLFLVGLVFLWCLRS